MELVLNSEACNGCRICELACSFHHQRVFAPEYSSLKVSSDYREGKIHLSLEATCDFCLQESQPMCVQYCVTGALQKREGE